MGIISINIGYRNRNLNTLIVAFINYFTLLDTLVGELGAVISGYRLKIGNSGYW